MDYLSLCLICKDENDYLPEWLDYHILAGVDRFYIYDNESQLSLRQTLREYTAKGWVEVIDLPGKAMQLPAYDHCLQTFGARTRWLGFIDTDEFLVPRTALDLKDLLKEYEPYGGLAVSSLFFGSGGHKERPAAGQLAGYTLRTPTSFSRNSLIKSIVQPERVLMPYSPHEFVFKEGSWCVNEAFLRVDYQKFPNSIQKVQLNHYFCRSESEIERKLQRGRGDAGNLWAANRFEWVDLRSTCQDTAILQRLEILFQEAGLDPLEQGSVCSSSALLEKMAALAQSRVPPPLETAPLPQPIDRQELFHSLRSANEQIRAADARKDYAEAKRLILHLLEITSYQVKLTTDLGICCLNLNDPEAAWKALGQAWKLAPNSYYVLLGMARYFVAVQNHEMAEKTCLLLLNIDPRDLTTLALLTESLHGSGRFEQALAIGLPVIEISAAERELPMEMDLALVNKLARVLQEKKDFSGAAHLWETYAECHPGTLAVLLEWSQALFSSGERAKARQVFSQAQTIAPEHAEVLRMQRKFDPPTAPKGKRQRH